MSVVIRWCQLLGFESPPSRLGSWPIAMLANGSVNLRNAAIHHQSIIFKIHLSYLYKNTSSVLNITIHHWSLIKLYIICPKQSINHNKSCKKKLFPFPSQPSRLGSLPIAMLANGSVILSFIPKHYQSVIKKYRGRLIDQIMFF